MRAQHTGRLSANGFGQVCGQRNAQGLLVIFLGIVLALLYRLEDGLVAATQADLGVDPRPVEGSRDGAGDFLVRLAVASQFRLQFLGETSPLQRLLKEVRFQVSTLYVMCGIFV